MRSAKELHIPATRLNDIVRGRRGITADTALRRVTWALQRSFGSIFSPPESC
jgi:plasmid maintenance system antidote protein VapI